MTFLVDTKKNMYNINNILEVYDGYKNEYNDW